MSASRLFVVLHTLLSIAPSFIMAQALQSVDPTPTIQSAGAPGLWSAPNVEHISGLPDAKPHKKGTLSLTADKLTFKGKTIDTSIPRSSITAASAGNERVEMWGLTGRLMRMGMQYGGGYVTAAVLHHRIDMLTVEYNDARGGSHSAVFFLGANLATAALESFALQAKTPHATLALDCENALTEPSSIYIAAPDWNGAEVPAVYKGLIYEHLIERFRRAKSLDKVYREGETMPRGLCPRYTVNLTITGFKEGSSVKRAMFGPVGMFVGTTQMVFDAELSDRTGIVKIKEQVKTTVRGEKESTNVADSVAKTLVKKYEKAVKVADKEARKSSTAPKT
ncbi:hypothetical protein BH10ACI4_BH10ACI4_08920 [soil metagenome]